MVGVTVDGSPGLVHLSPPSWDEPTPSFLRLSVQPLALHPLLQSHSGPSKPSSASGLSAWSSPCQFSPPGPPPHPILAPSVCSEGRTACRVFIFSSTPSAIKSFLDLII